MKKLVPYLILVIFVGGCLAAQETVPDHRIALRQLIERAKENDPKALYDLAKLHDIGYDTIEVDSAKSTSLYLHSANLGYAPAQNYLGFRYFTGQSVNKDIDSAMYWIRKAADNGDITAAANLAYMLSENPELALDGSETLKWMNIAAEEGVVPAQENIAKIKKEYWQSLPADSALAIGLEYYLGKAPVLGVALFESAASKGSPQAYALLGDAYTQGRGVPYDHNKSLDYFYKAAAQGNPSAQFILSELLEIFPDALSTLINEENTDLNDIFSASALMEKAIASGIKDAESAYEHLYSLPDSDSTKK